MLLLLLLLCQMLLCQMLLSQMLLLLLSRIWEGWSRHDGQGGGSSWLRRGRVKWVHGGVGGRHEVTRLVDNYPLRSLDKLLS